MLKIVSFKICPFVQRVIALLESKGIEYDVEYISLRDKPQWFLDISPNGQVPVLIAENGTPIFESEAIIEYIEDVYPRANDARTPEQKALERAWGYLGAKNYLVQCSAMQSSTKDVLDQRMGKLGTAFDKIEKALGDTIFFSGDTVGHVDIAWITLLHRAAIIEARSGYDMIGATRPKVKAWQKAVLDTGLGPASVAEDFEIAFSDFYLSDETYLGNGCCDVSRVDPNARCGSGKGGCC